MSKIPKYVEKAIRRAIETYPSGHKDAGAFVLIIEDDYCRLHDLQLALDKALRPAEATRNQFNARDVAILGGDPSL